MEEEEEAEGSEGVGAEVSEAVGMAAVEARTEEDKSAASAKRFADVSNLRTDYDDCLFPELAVLFFGRQWKWSLDRSGNPPFDIYSNFLT